MLLFFCKWVGNEFENLQVWSRNSIWQLWLVVFVCLAAWVFFRATGTRELLECDSVSVLGWAVSLICSFNLRVALQQREPNFSPSSSLLLLASYHARSSKHPLLAALPLSSSFFRLQKRLEQPREADSPWRRLRSRAHSGHCVQARNNIYRSPLWAPWKQSQY